MSDSLNDYSKDDYLKTNIKPDKRFSILPTILLLIGDVKGKTVLDLGCGDGFFTRPIAKKGALKVIGIDNSREEIDRAKTNNPEDNITYKELDIFKEKLPEADIIVAPFILNYAKNVEELKDLFVNIHDSLTPKGKFIGVMDYPDKGANLKKFGAIKKLLGKEADGTKIKIDLYNIDKHLITLYSYYYTQPTVKRLVLEVGFKKFLWKPPIISHEGIRHFGPLFWKDYAQNPGLGYFWAQKK